MEDHYKTLGLTMRASQADIKKAFRVLAKKYHPDHNAGHAKWATCRMQRLLEANRVLSTPCQKEIYDRKYIILVVKQKPENRRKYRRRADGLAAKAEDILQDLLSNREDRAVETYEQLRRGARRFDLRDHLMLRDWVDCKFLIAEQYQERSEYEKALGLYEELYHSNEARRRYTQFMREVHDRIVRIYCRHLAPAAVPMEAAHYYLRALGIEQGRGRRAFLHKKLAECHMAIGDKNTARSQLGMAFELKPDLKGATKICQKLGFVPG